MNTESKLLLRYLDREMSPAEAEQFGERLANCPALCRELEEMQRVGALLRLWSGDVEARGGELVESTLGRVQDAARRRARVTMLACGLSALLLLALHGAERAWQASSEPLTRVVWAGDVQDDRDLDPAPWDARAHDRRTVSLRGR